MPIYEYQCESCGRRSESLQKISDPPLTTCEECSGSLTKLISAPSFQFKGSGWYVTDYADKDKKSDKDGEGDSKSGDSGSGDAGSSDAKSKDGKSEGEKGGDSKSSAKTTKEPSKSD